MRRQETKVRRGWERWVRPGGAAAGLMFLGVAFGVYGLSLGNEFVYDDFEVIVKEDTPLTLNGVTQIFSTPHYPFLPYYRPVTRLSFMLQKAVDGSTHPLPYHVVNVFLAAVLGWASYLLFRLKVFGLKAPLPLLGALLVTVHPVTSSSVYPAASGRETLLPVVLALAGIYFYLKGGLKSYWLSLVLAGLALFGKEQMVVVPVLLVIADALKLTPQYPKPFDQWWKRWLPLGLLLGGYFWVRWQVFGGVELAFQNRLDLVLGVPFFAIQDFFLPFWELRYEPMMVKTWLVWPRLVLGTVLALGLGGMALSQRGWRLVIFFLSFFWLGLLPNANVISQDASFSERYLLLSLIGLTAVCVSGLSDWIKQPGFKGWVGKGFLAILGVLAWVSVNRAQYFRNNLLFHQQWAKTSPGYFLPYFNLARSYEEIGLIEPAMRSYEKSLELNRTFAPSYLNLGSLLLNEGSWPEAYAYFENFRRLSPDSAKAYYHLGLVQLQVGEYAEAQANFEVAVGLDPGLVEAFNNLGVVYQLQGNEGKARESFERAIELDASFLSARRNLERLTLEQ